MAIGALAQALGAFTSPQGSALATWALGCLAVILGLTILIGFLTPLASAAATLGFLITGVSRLVSTGAHRDSYAFTAFNLAVMSASLALLGPGAVSLDARLYGRREITIPESPRSPR